MNTELTEHVTDDPHDWIEVRVGDADYHAAFVLDGDALVEVDKWRGTGKPEWNTGRYDLTLANEDLLTRVENALRRMADYREKYPEHTKLTQVKDESQALGEFLDYGLPRLGGGMVVYEHIHYDCECSWCANLKRSLLHTEEELATAAFDEHGRMTEPVQIEDWQPTVRTIPSMLAEYFGIDEEKLNAEKKAMLDAMQAANA